MNSIEQMVEALTAKNLKLGFESMEALEHISEQTDHAARFLTNYFELLVHPNSYVRTRGLVLIAANAKWDKNNIIDQNIEDFLAHIQDEKPITARKCISVLPELAKQKPRLKGKIVLGLKSANPPDLYADSMWPLVVKDIETALQQINDA